MKCSLRWLFFEIDDRRSYNKFTTTFIIISLSFGLFTPIPNVKT